MITHIKAALVIIFFSQCTHYSPYCIFQKHANASYLTFAFFAAVNHLTGPLRKQRFYFNEFKVHGLWFVIGEFQSVLCFYVFQGPLLVVENMIDCRSHVIIEKRSESFKNTPYPNETTNLDLRFTNWLNVPAWSLSCTGFELGLSSTRESVERDIAIRIQPRLKKIHVLKNMEIWLFLDSQWAYLST